MKTFMVPGSPPIYVVASTHGFMVSGVYVKFALSVIAARLKTYLRR